MGDVQAMGDEADEIRLAIDRAFEQSDVVLTTGGLGPTKDDITKGVMRDYFGGELREDPAVLANVMDVVGRRGFKINALTAAQGHSADLMQGDPEPCRHGADNVV